MHKNGEAVYDGGLMLVIDIQDKAEACYKAQQIASRMVKQSPLLRNCWFQVVRVERVEE